MLKPTKLLTVLPTASPAPIPAAATSRGAAAGGERADVHIRTDSHDQVHVDVDTHGGAGGKARPSSGSGAG